MNLHSPINADTDAMLAEPNLRLRVGEHVVDVGALKVISRPDAPRLTSKAAAVLIELVRHAGNTVTRDRLLDVVWKGRCPTPDVLTQAIKELRRAFADDAKPSHYVETVPKVGYRLIAPVCMLGAAEVGSLGLAGGDAMNDGASDSSPSSAPPQARMSGALKWILPAAAALVLLGVAFAYFLRAPASLPVMVGTAAKWQATDLHAITSDPGGEYRPHLSPDGTRVAYSRANPDTGFQRLLVRSVEPSQAITISESPSEHSASPIWSPDGRQIAFQRFTADRCEVFVVQSLGGNEREIGPCGNYVYTYFDWTSDGNGLITSDRISKDSGAFALTFWNLASGAKTPLHYPRTSLDQDLEAHYSPNGRWLAFRRGLAPYSDLMVMPVSGGEVRQLTQLTTRIRGYTWTSDSSALVFSSAQSGQFELYAVGLDGAVQRLGVGPAEYPDAAPTGNLVVYEIPRTQNALAEFPLGDGIAQARIFAASTGNDSQAALSADGKMLAFISDRSGSRQVWVHDPAAETTLPLTDFKDAIPLSENWRPDGKALLAIVRDAKTAQLVEIDLASRRQRVLSKPGEHVLHGVYGLDADSLLMLVGPSARNDELVVVRHAGEAQESRSALVSGVEYLDLDRASRTVYYTKASENGLFRRSVDGGPEQFVTTKISAVHMDGWSVVDGAIWYIRGMSIAPAELHKFDPATGQDVRIGRLDAELRDLRFAVAPQRDRVIISKVRTEDIDVGAFTLRRGG